jgi:cytosine/adenosine deaminase-related metal-dependent hydrolase
MLLEADWVLPITEPPIADGAVRVADGVIGAVGPTAELRARFPEDEAQKFSGCALLPGLVNSHTHLDYSAFRGFAQPCGFGDWMLRLLLARRKLDLKDFEMSALWGAYECARSGVTAIADTSYGGWTVARAARAAGLRARVYLEFFGLDDAQLPSTMERLEAGLGRLRSESGPIVEAGLSPHASYSVSARLYREAARFARRAGLRLATHVAESEAEVELLSRGTGAIAQAYRAAHMWKGQRWTPPGMSPVQYVARTGALGPEMLAIHAVQLDEDDIATLAESGAAVAHCPRSNLRLQCGVAPVAALLGAGVTVGLGTDSLGSNDNLDMFAEMRAAVAVSRGRVAPAAALRMATLDGARALGWGGQVGSLEAGKRGDVIAVRLSSERGTRAPAGALDFAAGDPTVALVGAATVADVQMTMVDGFVVFDGQETPVQVVRGLAVVRAKLGLRD